MLVLKILVVLNINLSLPRPDIVVVVLNLIILIVLKLDKVKRLSMIPVSYVQPHLVHHMPQGGLQRPGRSRSPTSGTRSTSLSWEKISVGGRLGRVWITGEGKVASGRKEEESKSEGINKSLNIKVVEEGVMKILLEKLNPFLLLLLQSLILIPECFGRKRH